MNNLKKYLSILITLLFCNILAAQSNNYRALCVGISDYPDAADDLPTNITNDAIDMEQYLILYQGWSDNNIEVKLNSAANATDITNYISNMPNSRGINELFIYSGHGTTDGLLTYSGSISPANLETAFGTNYYQWGAFLNACYSGIFTEQLTKGEVSTVVKSNQKGYAVGPDNNSPYFYYVLEAIKNNQADPIQGHVVSTVDIHNYAKGRTHSYVYNNYQAINDPQYKGTIGILNLSPNGPTLSGTLVDDELWDHDITLNGNVIIPSGKILALHPGITVNLNNYCLVINGLLFQNNATLNYNVALKQDGIIKGFSNSLNIVNYSLPGQIVEVVNSFTNSGSIAIPGGVELKINSGKTLTLSSGSILTFASTASFNVYGTLNANSTTFDFTTPYNQNGIKLHPGSAFYSSNNIVRNAWYGVYKNCYSALTNLEAYNCQYGVYVYGYGTDNYIAGLNLHGNAIGLALINYPSLNEVVNCDIYSNTQGILCSNTTAEISGNNIYNNTSYGINVYNTSFPCLGKVYPPVDCGQQNNIYNNGTYNIYNQVTGVLYALHNWWGSNPPLSSKFYSTNGTVVYTPYLTAPADQDLLNNSTLIAMEEEENNSLMQLLRKTNELIGQQQFEPAREICIDVINDYPDSAIAYNFLSLLPKTYSEGNDGLIESKNLLNSIFSKRTNKKLYGTAGLMLAYMDDEPRIKRIDEVISKYEGTELIELALYDKFLYYFHEEKNIEKAREVLADIDERFPESEGALDAHRTLGDKELIYSDRTLAKNGKSTKAPKTFEVSNFPNPFNPSTTIKYSLPTESSVELRIFDIMGREIKAIIQGTQAAGYCNVVWDGTNNFNEPVTSGIYIFTIKAKSLENFQFYEKSLKLMLMK